MKTTVNEWEFIDSFKQAGRENNFSYEGRKALFDYLEELENDLDEEFELDPIALCCEYTEYENLEELQGNYNNIENMDDLEANTFVIMTGDESFIIQDY